MNWRKQRSGASKGLTGFAAFLSQPPTTKPSTPSEPAPHEPSFKTRHPKIYASGQILLFGGLATLFALLIILLPSDDGLGLDRTNALGALAVAIGGTLGIVGEGRQIKGATSASWSCVLMGGWLIALASFWPLFPEITDPLRETVEGWRAGSPESGGEC